MRVVRRSPALLITIDNTEVPVLIEIAGIAGMEPTFRACQLGRRAFGGTRPNEPGERTSIFTLGRGILFQLPAIAGPTVSALT